jgi:protein-S-isoprenylcysteine O-methyltransferase Ste14
MDLHKAVRDPWVWGQVALIGTVAVLSPLLPRLVSLGDLDHALNRVDPGWIRLIGAGIGIAGLALTVWGVRSLGASLTPGTEPLPGGALVTGRAYAHLRHPIYGGVVLMLAGYTIAWANWTMGLIVGVVALQYFEAKARAEEVWLRDRYPDYRTYALKVRHRVL